MVSKTKRVISYEDGENLSEPMFALEIDQRPQILLSRALLSQTHSYDWRTLRWVYASCCVHCFGQFVSYEWIEVNQRIVFLCGSCGRLSIGTMGNSMFWLYRLGD